MKLPTSILACLTAFAISLPGAVQARAVKTGTLQCRIAPGVGFIIMSRKELDCRFTPRRGRPEYYRGVVSRLGVDIGVTGGGVIIWGVFEPTYHPNVLGGRYVGASAEASIVGGIGANALIGGSTGSVALQPLSVQGQIGLDVAAGIGEMVLERVR